MRARRKQGVFRFIGGFTLGVWLLAGACASPLRENTGTNGATIPAGRYDDAFHAAKDVLRAAHFDLERIDAAAGVITTQPRSSAGLATPWLDYDETFAEGVNDLIHRDRRRVTIRFDPSDRPDASALVDRRTLDVPLNMRVTIDVERTYVTGRRANPSSIRLISRTTDPQLTERGIGREEIVTVGQDEPLAERIAKSIEGQIQAKTGR